VNIVGIHKGTKLTETPKKHTLNFRYDDETAEKLEYVAKKCNITKSEVVRRGIEIQYNKEKE
jgi:predicted DNA-binding protein